MATQAEDLTGEDFDEDAPDLVLDEDDVDDAGDDAAEGDDQEQGESEDAHHIAFGDDEPIAGEEDSPGVRNLREELKREKARRRELERQVAPPTEVGEEPNMDDFWDDPDGYKKALREYDARKAEAEKGQQERQALNDAVEREIADSAATFERQRASLKVANFDGALDRVKEKVGETGERILSIVAGEKSAALAYALGNSADRLDALGKFNLNKITDLVRFAAEIGSMAKVVEVKQGRKPATQPESVQRGGGAPPRGDARRVALEKEADATGDDSKLIRYDYNQRNKNRG